MFFVIDLYSKEAATHGIQGPPVLSILTTLVHLPIDATEGQSSLDVSDSDGPASLPSDSSQSQLPPGAALRGSGNPEGQNHCLLRSFVRPRGSAGEGSLVSSQALGVSGPLRTRTSLPSMLDRQAFLDPNAEGQPPGKGAQGRESLVQCVKVNTTFQRLCVYLFVSSSP